MTMIGARRQALRAGALGFACSIAWIAEAAQRTCFFIGRQDRPGARLWCVDEAPGDDATESLAEWLKRNGQTDGAIDRFWRLVIASALNADLDVIALPYAAKVIRELFMNSARAGNAWG